MSEESVCERWETVRLCEITEKIADRDHYTPTYVEDGVIMVSPKDFDEEGRIDFSNCQYITRSEHQRNRRKTDITAGDLVFTRIGARLGKACLVKPCMPDFSLLHSAVMIRTVRHRVLPEYLLFVLKSSEIQSQIGREIQSIGVPDLGLDKINAFSATIPPLPQQRKIARILTTVDNLIEKTEALIAKYQAIKQGMMHDLFTRGVDEHGHLRPPYEEAPELYKESDLGWIPKEWEVSLLDDSIRIIDCKHYTPQFRKEGLPFIRPRNVKLEGLDLTDVEFVSSDDFRLLTDKHQPRRGDIVFSRNASFGVPCFIDHDHPFAIGQDTVVMTKKMVNTKYVFYALLSATTEQQVRKASTGSTFGRINLAFIRSIQIPLPKSREQLEISQRLNGIVGQIINESFALDKLRLVKSGLMQDLLTGKVRVKVDEVEDVFPNV